MMASGVATPDDGDKRLVKEKVMEGSPEQISAMLQAQFAVYDKDNSGDLLSVAFITSLGCV